MSPSLIPFESTSASWLVKTAKTILAGAGAATSAVLLPEALLKFIGRKLMTLEEIRAHREVIKAIGKRMAAELDACGKDISRAKTIEGKLSAFEAYEKLMQSGRVLSIIAAATDHYKGKEKPDPQDPPAETPGCWYDHFEDFARKRAEPWRMDLLARALAAEQQAPGRICLRTLWTIGMLEEQQFHMFSAYLDNCAWLADYPILCMSDEDMQTMIKYPGNADYEFNFQFMIPPLSDMHLLGTASAVQMRSDTSTEMVINRAFYEIVDRRRMPAAKKFIDLKGHCLSDIGMELSTLYPPKKGALAQKNLKWIKAQLHELGDISIRKVKAVPNDWRGNVL